MRVAKEWLVGSPNNDWSESDFSSEPENALMVYSAHGQSVSVIMLDNEYGKYAGLRYEWVEDSKREWVTELVAKYDVDRLWISVRLSCTLLVPRSKLPRSRKPYIIKQLFEELGGGNDGSLMAADWAHWLVDADLKDAANMILGYSGNRLPIVYVSCDFQGKPRVDVEGLARALSGMAHVVVEPSRAFAHRLMREVKGNNAYGGAVGIYWPNGAGAHLRILPWSYNTSRDMADEVVERVRVALCNIRASPDCTWSYLNDLLSQHRIELLKASGSTELNEFIEAFDADIRAKDIRLREAESEIARLQAEIRRFESAQSRGGEGILTLGKEQALYPGEIHDVVLDVLREGLAHVERNSRRRHIIDDILSVNEESGIRESLIDEIKRALATEEFGNREARALQELNFSISENGKHYKAVYCGDGRYTFSISKTSSDFRAGKNLSSDIIRKLFK